MRALLCLLLPFAACAWTDEAADRAAIQQTIAEWNESFLVADATSQVRLFTSDADIREINRLRMLARPWSEVSTPKFTIRRVRFVTPDVALIDATVTQFGSVIVMNRTRWLLVMRKQDEGWRIASVRVLQPLMCL